MATAPPPVDLPDEPDGGETPPPAPPVDPPAPVPGPEQPPPPTLDPATIVARRQYLAGRDGELQAALDAHRQTEQKLRDELAAARDVFVDAEARGDAATEEIETIRREVALLTEADQESLDALEAARARFENLVVNAYQRQDDETALIFAAASSRDPYELTTARHYAQAIGEQELEAARAYTSLRREVEAELVKLGDRQARAQLEADNAQRTSADAVRRIEKAERDLDELGPPPEGSLASAAGWRFPVAGPNNFVDSWGAPRSGGRTHKGADLFADAGTPVVAIEPGVVTKVGTNSLGGLIVWLQGESGNAYYYAHLSGYAPGLQAGQRVGSAGLLGYVGNSGNAVTTPPHLHFEVHPDGGEAANPYPLLRAIADADAVYPPPAVPYAPLVPTEPPADQATPTTPATPATPVPSIPATPPDPRAGGK